MPKKRKAEPEKEMPEEQMPQSVVPEEAKPKKEKVFVSFTEEKIVTENSDAARQFFNEGRYGSLLEDGKVQLSLFEAFFLFEKGKIALIDLKDRPIQRDQLVRRAQKTEKNFLVKYAVFKDLRNRGYTVKTALKFGADFRVYDRGVKPGEDHAKWIVYPVHESGSSTWYEFAAKNRVAHSTKKKLLIGIVDDEGDVTYYEIRWIRP